MPYEDMVWLFAYGTLRQRDVQLTLFSRLLDGTPDALVGYKLSTLLITEPDVIAMSGTAHHTMARQTGNALDQVPGLVFRINNAELAVADEYEVACQTGERALGVPASRRSSM